MKQLDLMVSFNVFGNGKKMEDKIFVYGTLMRKHSNTASSIFHRDNEFLGEGFIYGRLYNISWYPGLIVDDEVTDKVYGEVFRLSKPKNALALLDEYEGIRTKEFPMNQYERRQVKVYAGSEEIICWTYIFLDEVDEVKRIVSGRF